MINPRRFIGVFHERRIAKRAPDSVASSSETVTPSDIQIDFQTGSAIMEISYFVKIHSGVCIKKEIILPSTSRVNRAPMVVIDVGGYLLACVIRRTGPEILKAPVGAQIGSIADIAQIRAAGDLPRIQNISAHTLLFAIAQMPCFVLTALDVDLRDDRPVLRAQVARPDFAVAEPVSGVVPTRVQAVGVIVFYSLAFYRRRHGPGRQAPPSMRAQTPPRSHGLHSISFFDPPVPCSMPDRLPTTAENLRR